MAGLETSKLFSQLPAADLQKLVAETQERQFPAGGQIFREGDQGDGVYVVKSGAVHISGILSNGQRQIFSEAMPGDIFGEMAVLDQLPRSASATAQQDTTVYFIPRDEMAKMLHSSPKFAVSLVQETSRRLREFNRQYLQQVLQAERMSLVGRFASSIVHDLKNPLTIINIAAESACLDSATPKSRQTSLDRITRQVDRITSLINDILEFTRGAQTAQAFTLIDYSTFITGLIGEIQSELTHKSVHINFENQPPAVKLPLNPKRISRLFYNLINNAVDALPNGGSITLRFSETDAELVTEIEDSGPGIPKEVLGRVFEPFVTHGKERGTGLGLSICHRIIHDHQGKISVRNQSNSGAVFTILLPKHR